MNQDAENEGELFRKLCEETAIEREKEREKKNEISEVLRNYTYPDIKLEIELEIRIDIKYTNNDCTGSVSIYSVFNSVDEKILILRQKGKIIDKLSRVFIKYVENNEETIDLSDYNFNRLYNSYTIEDLYNAQNENSGIEIISYNVELTYNYEIISAKIIR
jgi:hypothetical protein